MNYPELISFANEECTPDKESVCCFAPYYMLHFVKNGIGYFNGIKLEAGDGFLASYGEWIEYHPDKDNPWSYAWLNFSDKEVLHEILTTIKLDEHGIFKFDVSFPYYETLRDMHDIKWHHHRIISDYEEKHLSSSVFHIIMSYLKADKFCKNDGKPVSVRENHVRECERLIEQHYHKGDTSVQKIAEKLHLSRAYLRNIFVEYRGMPPQKYLLDFRMKRAAEFLLSSDSPIGYVSSSVGYTDQFQFSKLFKKHYGVSPKEYRNNGGNIK